MDSSSHWKPSASLEALKARAELYQYLRQFFLGREVLEVETPVLGLGATVDPHIDSLTTDVLGQTYYLQTSPEFFLKRLLASNIGSVYSLGKVFRQGEKGARHHPEFTMLEWYQVDWDEKQLIEDVFLLLRPLFPNLETLSVSYQSLFSQHLGIDPHAISIDELKTCADKHIDYQFDAKLLAVADKNLWLDLLMTHCVEPKLPNEIVAVYDYPESQAALSEIGHDEKGRRVARRFEVYVKRLELANGYCELRDSAEQRQRFQSDQRYRKIHGLRDYPYDTKLVAALESGLPACAGVALGVDRLLMLMLKLSKIEEVLSFVD